MPFGDFAEDFDSSRNWVAFHYKSTNATHESLYQDSSFLKVCIMGRGKKLYGVASTLSHINHENQAFNLHSSLSKSHIIFHMKEEENAFDKNHSLKSDLENMHENVLALFFIPN